MVESIKEVKKICYSSEYIYRAWYNKYVSKLSIYVTWLLLHTRITANQVTISEYFLIIFGSVFLFMGKLEYIFVGLMIYQLTNLLDCVDGEIARYRKAPSLVGVHLEYIYHQIISHFMFFPLAFGVFIHTGWTSILILGFLCSIFSKSVVQPNMFSAICESQLGKITPLSYLKNKEVGNGGNLQGSKKGKKLSDFYDNFKDFWAAPTNLLQLTIISILELFNQSYHLFPPYTLFYVYFGVYAFAVTGIQLTSLIVHYKGKAIENYYLALFGKNKNR